jgi:hypothetical protein
MSHQNGEIFKLNSFLFLVKQSLWCFGTDRPALCLIPIEGIGDNAAGRVYLTKDSSTMRFKPR